MDAARTVCRGCHTFFEETFLAVCLPKVIVVQNNRLGCILRILQAATLGTLIGWGYTIDLWMTLESPSSFQQSLWFEPAQIGDNQSAIHCKNPRAYWFNLTGSFVSQPTGCRHLPAQAAYYDTATNQHGDTGIFFPTFVHDETTWQGSACGTNNGTCIGVTASTDCPCSNTVQYFTSNPEHQRLRLFHGFEVVPTYRSGSWAMRGTSRSPYITEGPISGDREVKGELLTIIQSEDGSPCSVGGRSEWPAESGKAGIVGTLQEWLSCGGVHIDSDPRTVLSDGERVAGLPSHLRTMGFTMQLEMEYTNRRHNFPSHKGVVCFLRVRIRPTWMLRKSTDAIQMGNQYAAHTRISTGVVVSTQVEGSFAFFELRKAVSAIAESMVLLQIPIIIVQFIALHCMGFISEMYRRAYRTSVNIYKEFHTTCARMMVMEVGFRGLLGGVWDGRVGESDGLTIENVFDHLCDIFHEAIDSGELNGADLKRLVTLMFADLDHDDTGSIACSEFINSCMLHDCVNVQDMVRFFATSHKGGIMTRFLDDASKHSDHKLKRLSTTERFAGMTGGGRASVGSHHGTIHIEELQNGSETSEFQAHSDPPHDDDYSEGTPRNGEPASKDVGPEGGGDMDANQDSSRTSLAERALSRPAERPLESPTAKASLPTAPLLGPTDASDSTEASDLVSRIVALEFSQVEMARRFERLEIRDMEHRLATWKDRDKSRENKAQANKAQDNKAQDNKAQDNKAQNNKAQDSKAPDNKAQDNKVSHSNGATSGAEGFQLARESTRDTLCSNHSLQNRFAKITSAASNEHSNPAQPPLPRPSVPGQGMHAYLRELEALVTGLRGNGSSARQAAVVDNGDIGRTSGVSGAPQTPRAEPATSVQDQLELQALKAELLLTSTKTVDVCKKIHGVFRTMESRVSPSKDGALCDDSIVGASPCQGHSIAASSCDGSPRLYASTEGHEGAPEPRLRGSLLWGSNRRQRPSDRRPPSDIDLS